MPGDELIKYLRGILRRAREVPLNAAIRARAFNQRVPGGSKRQAEALAGNAS